MNRRYYEHLRLEIPAHIRQMIYTRIMRILPILPRLIIFLPILMMICGCTSTTTSRWHADDRFSEEERANIIEGMSWLERQSGRDFGGVDFDYHVTSEQPLPHTIRRESGPHGTGECVASTVYLGHVDTLYQPGLMAHELAHCELGFVDGYHKGDVQTNGIMRVLYPMQWTAVEQEQLERNSK